MSFTPDPNLHLIICYDHKSSLYLRASIMHVHEVAGKTAIQPLLVFSKEETREYLFPSIDGKFAMERLPIPGTGETSYGVVPELEGFVLRQTQYEGEVPTLVYDLIIGEKGRSPGTDPLLVLKKYLDLEELRRDASKFMDLNKELEGIYTNPVFEWYKEFTDEWGNTIQDHWVFGRSSKGGAAEAASPVQGISAHLNGELVNILPAVQWIAVIYWKYQCYL